MIYCATELLFCIDTHKIWVFDSVYSTLQVPAPLSPTATARPRGGFSLHFLLGCGPIRSVAHSIWPHPLPGPYCVATASSQSALLDSASSGHSGIVATALCEGGGGGSSSSDCGSPPTAGLGIIAGVLGAGGSGLSMSPVRTVRPYRDRDCLSEQTDSPLPLNMLSFALKQTLQTECDMVLERASDLKLDVTCNAESPLFADGTTGNGP